MKKRDLLVIAGVLTLVVVAAFIIVAVNPVDAQPVVPKVKGPQIWI
jgi:hypothetical protein